ncbi:unnamed protein product [Linum tenue]|uniref:Uncharacterized protein n=1 Tax=Linum tenue TaxID=586396 RepID=A0AAV0M5K8_9ROSI|nr:unnamed protein product [Linum tenue]
MDENGVATGQCKYRCGTAAETLQWIKAIIEFIQPYNFLITAQVVNFFTDRLWEALDKEWVDCLRNEPVQHLLLIPSGVVQDHWPASLKQFILTLRSLAFPREQVNLQKLFPKLNMTSIEVLSAIVSSITNEVGAEVIVDVGAGQSAERWSCLDKDAGLQNFDLHAFRAVFHLLAHNISFPVKVLFKYYPGIITSRPSVGRQGKALRRKQQRGVPYSLENAEGNKHFLLETSKRTNICNIMQPPESRLYDDYNSALNINANSDGGACDLVNEGLAAPDKCTLFEKFSVSGLSRLGLEPLQEIDFHEIWSESQPYAELIGPYWSLRAAMGPVLETLLLLDRLLFLQEQDGLLDVAMFPIFDPALSPRNLAIIARRT